MVSLSHVRFQLWNNPEHSHPHQSPGWPLVVVSTVSSHWLLQHYNTKDLKDSFRDTTTKPGIWNTVMFIHFHSNAQSSHVEKQTRIIFNFRSGFDAANGELWKFRILTWTENQCLNSEEEKSETSNLHSLYQNVQVLKKSENLFIWRYLVYSMKYINSIWFDLCQQSTSKFVSWHFQIMQKKSFLSVN